MLGVFIIFAVFGSALLVAQALGFLRDERKFDEALVRVPALSSGRRRQF